MPGSAVGYSWGKIGRLTALGDTFVGGPGNVARGFAYNPASQVASETRDNDASEGVEKFHSP